MKFLIDAQLPPGLCLWLRQHGHEAEHVYELLGAAAEDRDIAAHAERHGFAVISKDEDFLHLRRPSRFPLLWLRCGNTTNRLLLTWLEERWEWTEELLESGEGLIELA
jgi:predicted nuclease of predicted toxin-antitoxin system